MVIIPIWVVDENEKEYLVLLGSEPKINANKETLPKNCVENIIYAPMIHESGYKFAICTIKENDLPEKLKNMISKE